MSDKKYAVKRPTPLGKSGGWIGVIKDTSTNDIVYETLQPTEKMAFIECIYWLTVLVGATKSNPESIAETQTEPISGN